ncbi:MAG: VWA domain-containing protein [Cyclobacteriaceae bacterium]|nr:VWA domain-containing protein [Cyclobacteriaceae bacterium]
MTTDAVSSQPSLAQNSRDAITRFFRFARQHGLSVGLGETEMALEAAQLGLMARPDHFKYMLRCICCGTQADLPVFEEIYYYFWTGEQEYKKSKVTVRDDRTPAEDARASLILMGTSQKGRGNEENQEAKNMSGANGLEKLRKTDLCLIAAIDEPYFDELAQKLWRQMSYRMKRRMKTGNRGGAIDFNKTIRKSIPKGGWPGELVQKQRKKVKKRIVMLLDVSGSMDKYSFYLLKFICVLRAYFEKIEAFTFSTELRHVTPYLEAYELQKALQIISSEVKSWSSGTRIGDCLADFNANYAKDTLSRSSIVIVLSDGLDTGDPDVLENAIKGIKLKTKQLIWLNPLKGMEGYQPIQRGMSRALPFVDEFRSAHTLDSLLELENFLSYV